MKEPIREFLQSIKTAIDALVPPNNLKFFWYRKSYKEHYETELKYLIPIVNFTYAHLGKLPTWLCKCVLKKIG